MKVLRNALVLLFAALCLAGCGGGGGGSQGAFSPTPADTIVPTAASTSISTNSFTTITVAVSKHDGTIENDGVAVTASLSPSTIGTVSGKTGDPAGTTASNTLAGGKTTFNFTSSNQAGMATITFSLPAGTNGATVAASASIPITVVAGNTNDPRLVLTPSAVTLPLNPYAALAEVGPDFVSNYLGSPYIAEITVTWRHSNGQLVNGTSTVNVSIDPATIAGFSQLDNPATAWTDKTKPDNNEFLVILGSGPINVTGGNGVIFIHADDIPGTAVLTVTAIDPDNNQTISSQVQVTIAGAASSLPSSISLVTTGSAYVASSGGPQDALVSATVRDGNSALVPDPSGFDNVQFQIVGPAGTDARLSGLNAAGLPVVGSTVSTVTHNGVASLTFQAGSQQGPVEIKATADRGDNNVDNGVQDAISSTATVVVSDGKLFSLTIVSPDTTAITASAVSDTVTEVPVGSANYQLPISVKGVDRFGNAVLAGTVVRFGLVDSPQVPSATTLPQNWFSISGLAGDPKEGATLFNATDGKFTTAGGQVQLGDTLIVFGKQATNQTQDNDDLESAGVVRSINSATSLTVATPFNLNDGTGLVRDYGPVIPYLIGRAEFGSVASPAFTDALTGTDSQPGVATTTLNYPGSAIGKAVVIYAQSNSTDYTSHTANIVTDTATLVFPGLGPGRLTASPDPLQGDAANVPVTVCYSDSLNQPIANFRLNFSFELPAGGTGKVDNIATSGPLDKVTGANGCVTALVTTTGLPAGAGSASLTFTAGVTSGSVEAPSVTVGFVVNIASMQVSPCNISTPVNNNDILQTINVKILSSSGSGVGGQAISMSCVAAGTPTPTITPSSGSSTTDASGVASFTIELSNFDPTNAPAPTGTGVCTFTGPDNLKGTVNINGQCVNDGFSP
ncbi:MAG TPA: hypothetical protein VGH81_03765 [Rudaea sp.]|jgi:hypothetical protein